MKYMKAWLLSATVVVLPLLGQQPKTTTTYFEIHLVVDCASTEKIVVKARPDDKQYCIEPTPVVTDRDVSSSSAKSTSDSSTDLTLTLGAAGSGRLYKATADHWLRGEGSLAVMINGEVVGVSRIYEPLGDDLVLARMGTKEEVISWAGELRSRARPSVQAREVVACPPGASGALTVEGTSEKFCLWRLPLLDERDVSAAEIARMDQGRLGLSVRLKASSLSKVRESSENLLGRKVGFIVNNRLMMVSSVSSPIGSLVTIYGNFNKDELHSLVAGINAETNSQP